MRMPQPEKCRSSISVAARPARALAAGDAGEQRVAGVRGPHLARPLAPVERQHVGAELLGPERAARSASRSCAARARCSVGDAGLPSARASVGRPPGARRRRSPAPRTARSAPRRGCRRGETPNRSSPSSPAAPARCRVMRWYSTKPSPSGSPSPSIQRSACSMLRPQRRRQRAIAGALQVRAGEHHEQRRRVDAAVVAPERHLAERRHLAAARLVQDLAGLRVLRRIAGRRLRRRQEAEHAARQLRLEPEQLERGDDAVAAERRAEPGDARVRIRPGRRLGDHHLEIGERAVHPLVELGVGRADQTLPVLHLGAARPATRRSWRRCCRRAARGGVALIAHLAPDRQQQRRPSRAAAARARSARATRSDPPAADRTSAARAARRRRGRDRRAPRCRLRCCGGSVCPRRSRFEPRTSNTSAKSASNDTDRSIAVGFEPEVRQRAAARSRRRARGTWRGTGAAPRAAGPACRRAPRDRGW